MQQARAREQQARIREQQAQAAGAVALGALGVGLFTAYMLQNQLLRQDRNGRR